MAAPPSREEPIRGIDKLRTEVIQREGSEAIYRQTGMIAHVRVHGLAIDDQAVRGTATLLQPAVTLGPETTRLVSLVNYWEFGSAINGFSIRSYMWGCSYGMWSLFFDAGLIRELTELGFHPIENCERLGLPQGDRFYEYAKLVETFYWKRLRDHRFS